MKSSTKLALIGAVGLLTGATAFAQPSPDNETPPQHPPRGRPGLERPDPEARRMALLEKYDANKDGKLDDTELAALGKDVLEGKLQPPPGAGRRGPGNQGGPGGPGFAPQGRGGPGGPGFNPQGPDAPRGAGERNFGQRGLRDDGGPERPPFGPGQRGFAGPNSEEGRKAFEEHRREFLKKYDANDDGKLDAAEREAIGKDIEDGKLPPPLPPPPRSEPPTRK